MISASFTVIIIVITVLVSLAAFNDEKLKNKLIFYPYIMDRPSEYYRFITSGFIHANPPHLIFNMFSLYGFGQSIEFILSIAHFRWAFVILYISGIAVASLPSFIRHRNHSWYGALGASGGVSAVIFACIYYHPWGGISLLGLEWLFSIPGFVFGGLYLAYSSYMAKNGSDNIGHDAHFWGAVYGFIYAFCLDPRHGMTFIDQLRYHHF